MFYNKFFLSNKNFWLINLVLDTILQLVSAESLSTNWKGVFCLSCSTGPHTQLGKPSSTTLYTPPTHPRMKSKHFKDKNGVFILR